MTSEFALLNLRFKISSVRESIHLQTTKIQALERKLFEIKIKFLTRFYKKIQRKFDFVKRKFI